jgi:hypothetical protein
VPHPHPSTLSNLSCQTCILDPPFSCLVVPLRLILWLTSMCYLLLLTSLSLGCLLHFYASSPYAGSPMGGSQVPSSRKPSVEGTTVCLSSDSVQLEVGSFWYFGTIESWDASVVLLNFGIFGFESVELATVRQYRSAKQCSSIQPGTESCLHSHPTEISSSCSHKRKPLPSVSRI